jgi:drug/metabolite transporter (DMT)-like permease
MNWVVLALLGPAVYTIVNFIDKYIVERKVRDYRGMPIYATIAGFIFGSLFWVFSGMPILSFRDTMIVMLTGILSIFGYALYFNAISKSHTSYIIMLFQMMPVLSLILAFVILGEVINFKQLIGFILILAAVIGLSVNKEHSSFKLSTSFWLILIADFLFAISGVLIKFTLNANSFSKILSYESWGIGIGGTILFFTFPAVRSAFRDSFKSVGRKVLIIMFLNEGIFIVSKSITLLALTLGPVALVSVLGGTQVFYGILFGWVLTLLFPMVFKEEVSKRALFKKIIFSIILFSGIGLIY